MNKVAITILLATTTVHAESLEEKEYWKREMHYIDRSLAEVEKRCGFKPTFEVVDKPKLREGAEKTKSSAYGVCDAILQTVITICRKGEDEKAAVAAKIKGFQCGYAKPRTLDLEAGILKYMGNNEEANFSDWANPLLKKKL